LWSKMEEKRPKTSLDEIRGSVRVKAEKNLRDEFESDEAYCQILRTAEIRRGRGKNLGGGGLRSCIRKVRRPGPGSNGESMTKKRSRDTIGGKYSERGLAGTDAEK